MAEAALSGVMPIEFEIRGGPWEALHVVVFYGAVTSAVLATLGVLSLLLGIGCIVLLFYSMFTMFSSPTYVITDPAAREIILESYYYFIPKRSRMGRKELEGLEVIESPRVPATDGNGSRHDLSYFVRIYLMKKEGRRLKLFGSVLTGTPSENRLKAYYIVQGIAACMDIPVHYTRRGSGETGAEEPHGV